MEHFKYLLSLGLLLILAPGFSQIKYDSVLNNGVKRKIKISNTLSNAEISAQNILFRKTLQDQLRATDPLSALRQTEYITGVIDLEISTAGPACGYSNGKIQVTPKSGTSPFRYSIDGASFVAIGYFPFLDPGNHTLTVTDASDKSVSTIINLKNTFDRPKAELSLFDRPSGCSANDGKITIKTTGGTPPYTYSLDRFTWQTDNTFKNLHSNWFFYMVKDANGCETTANNGPLYNCSMGFGASYGGNICAGVGNTGLGVSAVWGGIEPYTYSIDGINYQPTGNFEGFKAGILNLHIKDATGKEIIYAIQITENCQLQLNYNKQNAICGADNGSLTINALNGVKPYAYSLDGITFKNTPTFNNLKAGTYSCMVKDAAGTIMVDQAIIIANTCLTLTTTASDVTCNTKGSIKINASNGVEPYQFSKDGINYQRENVFNDLEAGNYVITAKDSDGSIKTQSVSIKNISVPEIKFSATEANCFSGGTITVNSTGGIAPLLYSVNNITWSSNPVFSNLKDSTYSIFLNDSSGCQVSKCCIQVTRYCLALNASTLSTACGISNGTIKLAGTGGELPYTYSINGSAFGNPNIFASLAKGAYTLAVKDNRGTVVLKTVDVDEVCLSTNVTVQKATCGHSNGMVTLFVSKGTPPYAYSYNGGIYYQPGNVFSNLSEGSHLFLIKDAEGFSSTVSVTVNSLPPPSFSARVIAATCINNDGVINVTPIKGTYPFTFSLSGSSFDAGRSFNNLSSGSYVLSIMDSTGCVAASNIQVPIVNSLTVSAPPDTTICEGEKIVLNVTSNAERLTWNQTSNTTNYNGNNVIVQPATTTSFIITASTNQCVVYDTLFLQVRPAPVPDAGKDTTICFGADLRLRASGGQQYSWTPNTFLEDRNSSTPLVKKPTGTLTYKLSTIDANGCKSLKEASVIIRVLPPGILFAGNDTSIAKGQPVQLSVLDVNHVGFNAYRWVPVIGLTNSTLANPVATIQQTVTYSITASTSNGCQAKGSLTLKAFDGPEIYVPTAFTPNNDGLNDVVKALPIGMSTFSKFVIYNRFGQPVFITSDAAIGWNGTWKGIPQNTATFVWIATGTDFKGKHVERKGTITLMR